MSYLNYPLFICLFITAFQGAGALPLSDQPSRNMKAESQAADSNTIRLAKLNAQRFGSSLASLSGQQSSLHKESAPFRPLSVQADTKLTKWLASNLVIRKKNRIARASETRLPQAEYIAFYFSAGWCPPCRGFTPKLVDFYNKQSPKHDNFEIVFVSSDRSEEDQSTYMMDYNMPWPAVKFDEARDQTVREYSGSGIPCLVLVDREGNVIEDTYVNGKYMGPSRVMNKLDSLLN